MVLLTEGLVDSLGWWRIADPRWRNPLDPTFSKHAGGRWNPPGSFSVLYLNESKSTARSNLRRFVSQWPYEPDDLRESSAPTLVECRLPRRQVVCDVHTPAGVRAAGLPATYPLDSRGMEVPHAVCRPVGANARAAGFHGIRCRSAADPTGSARELAWFPATAHDVAECVRTLTFSQWYPVSSD